MHFFLPQRPFGKFLSQRICVTTEPLTEENYFSTKQIPKPHLSYFLFFHLCNCKKMLLSSCSCFCVGGIKKKKRSGQIGIPPEIPLLRGFALIFVHGWLSLGCRHSFVDPICWKKRVSTEILGWVARHKPMPRQGQGVLEHRQALPSPVSR